MTTDVTSRYGGRKEFRELQKLLAAGAMNTLAGRHRIGELVERLVPSSERNYGEQALTVLTKDLGLLPTSNILAKLRAFARSYSAAEAQHLEAPAAGRSYRLTWAHVMRFLSFKRGERERLEKECRAGEWTVAELHRRIGLMRKPKRKGGKPWKRPGDIDEALAQVQAQADALLKRSGHVWRCGAMPAISRKAIAAGGAETKRQATVTLAVLEQLAAAVEDLQGELRAGVAARKHRG